MYEALAITEPATPAAARRLLDRMARDDRTLAPRAIDKPLVLYGGGPLGRQAKDFLERFGIPVTMAVDRNAQRLRDEPCWTGVRMLAPDEVPTETRHDALLAVSVATVPFAPLAAELRAAGWRDIVPFYDIAEGFRDRHPLGNGWFAQPFRDEHMARIGTVLDGWADDLSRAHHLQFLAWRRLRQEWSFGDTAPLTTDRFFPDFVRPALGEAPRFLDLGAHHGGVTRHLIDIRPGFAHAWMIEPDPENRAVAADWLAGLPSATAKRITLLPYAVAASSGPRRFFGGLDYASQFSALGTDEVAARTVDDLDLAPSFIKMHLEGWELEAAKGCVETIRRQRPAIALTVCHNHLGLWETPSWFMAMLGELGGYDHYFRLENWWGLNALMYCIPRETGAR